MKFTAQAGELAGLLGHVKRSVPARSTIPILSHVEMIAHDNKLRIRGTNLDVEMWGFVDATTIEAGAVAVPAATFQAIVSRMKNDATVELAVAGERLTISSGRSRYDLSTLPLDGFPAPREPHAAEAATISIAPPDLAWLAAVTRGSVAPRNTGYAFTEGVCFQIDGERLTAVATDGKQLIAVNVPVGGDTNLPDVTVIPPQVMVEFEALSKTDEPEVLVKFDRSRTMISTDVGSATAALFDARFFDFRKQIPEREHPFAIASAEDLVEAADRAMMAYTGLDVNVATLILTTIGNGLSIETERNKQNDGHEEVDADLSEDGVSIKFDGKRFRNLMALWGEARVSFQFSEDRPDRLLIWSDDEPRMTQILMLMSG